MTSGLNAINSAAYFTGRSDNFDAAKLSTSADNARPDVDAVRVAGVSEIVAINDHQFLLDERDEKGLGDNSTAKIKQLFKIDLTGGARCQQSERRPFVESAQQNLVPR